MLVMMMMMPMMTAMQLLVVHANCSVGTAATVLLLLLVALTWYDGTPKPTIPRMTTTTVTAPTSYYTTQLRTTWNKPKVQLRYQESVCLCHSRSPVGHESRNKTPTFPEH